ncbi:MAG: membrane protein insertase YidC [Bacteroidota bacterium]
MNKNTINTIIGIVIIFGILVGYSIFTAPSKEEKAKMQHQRDSVFKAAKARYISDSIAKATAKNIPAADSVKDTAKAGKAGISGNGNVKDSNALKASANQYGSFSVASKGTQKYFIIENDLYKIKISKLGGGIAEVTLKTYLTGEEDKSKKRPIVLFSSDKSTYGISFFSNNKLINSADLYFEPYVASSTYAGKDSIVIGKTDSLAFGMRLYPNATDSTFDKSRFIEFSYALKGGRYVLGYTVNIENMQDVIANNTGYIGLDWAVILKQQERSLKNEEMVSTVYYKPEGDAVDYLSETKDSEKPYKAQVKWVSFKQQFFSSTLISKTSFKEANMKCTTLKKVADAKSTVLADSMKAMSVGLTLNYNSAPKVSYPMEFYFGPNQYKILSNMNLDLERQIPLGWSFAPLAWINRFVVIPVFNFLDGFNMNYGIIILLLTILLKIVLLPIAYKTYMSSAKMRVLKPEVEDINKKFPKKEDALKKQQATMALYKKAGVNPMSGCIPLLLQMPILIALYRFFPASIELRQKSFLWADDLSTYDSIAKLPFDIPFYGAHISLFTLLMTVTTIIYTKINNQMMGTTSQPGMKFLMYAMPVMFLGFFNNFAAGLSYYYFLANVITFLQMYLFRKFVNEDKVHERIQENKKKPTKTSGFQKRLEDMAKKRGYNTKK